MEPLENVKCALPSLAILLCYRATEPSMGLGMNADVISLKCYLGDTGLLLSQTFEFPAIQSQDIHERMLSGRLSINKGMIVETSSMIVNDFNILGVSPAPAKVHPPLVVDAEVLSHNF